MYCEASSRDCENIAVPGFLRARDGRSERPLYEAAFITRFSSDRDTGLLPLCSEHRNEDRGRRLETGGAKLKGEESRRGGRKSYT